MQKAQNAFASASHHGLKEEATDLLRKLTKAVDIKQHEYVREGLFRNRHDLTKCYTKGWLGGWGEIKCPEGLPPPWKEGDPIRNPGPPQTPDPRYADPRYQGGRRKTHGKKSKKSKKSKKTRRY